MRLKEKWQAIIATAGAASRRMTGRSGPTVSDPRRGRSTVVMAPQATGAGRQGSTSARFRLAARLALVEDLIRRREEGFERHAVPGVHRHADAHRDRRLLAVPRHSLLHPTGHEPRGVLPRLREDDGELVAPEPRRRVHRSEERRVGKECRSRWSPYH